jgi:hypothetical protein
MFVDTRRTILSVPFFCLLLANCYWCESWHNGCIVTQYTYKLHSYILDLEWKIRDQKTVMTMYTNAHVYVNKTHWTMLVKTFGHCKIFLSCKATRYDWWELSFCYRPCFGSVWGLYFTGWNLMGHQIQPFCLCTSDVWMRCLLQYGFFFFNLFVYLCDIYFLSQEKRCSYVVPYKCCNNRA